MLGLIQRGSLPAVCATTLTASLIAYGLYRRRRRLLSSSAAVRTRDGVTLPWAFYGPSSTPLALVVGHGLGSSDPANKTHEDDMTHAVFRPAMDEVGCRGVWYTARGHGNSDGWQCGGPEQFSWPRLASDMVEVADSLGLSHFVAAGNSMGSMTALCCAFEQPMRISALVLYRPPLIMAARSARRAALLAKADEHVPHWPYRNVLVGAATTNLPAADDPVWETLRAAGIPILILCHGKDEVHPVASGVALERLLAPHATLEIAEDAAAAEQTFPKLLARWLWRVASPAG
jgi:pimeloyl-ACP methyl ester carboxylesterase